MESILDAPKNLGRDLAARLTLRFRGARLPGPASISADASSTPAPLSSKKAQRLALSLSRRNPALQSNLSPRKGSGIPPTSRFPNSDTLPRYAHRLRLSNGNGDFPGSARAWKPGRVPDSRRFVETLIGTLSLMYGVQP